MKLISVMIPFDVDSNAFFFFFQSEIEANHRSRSNMLFFKSSPTERRQTIRCKIFYFLNGMASSVTSIWNVWQPSVHFFFFFKCADMFSRPVICFHSSKCITVSLFRRILCVLSDIKRVIPWKVISASHLSPSEPADIFVQKMWHACLSCTYFILWIFSK